MFTMLALSLDALVCVCFFVCVLRLFEGPLVYNVYFFDQIRPETLRRMNSNSPESYDFYNVRALARRSRAMFFRLFKGPLVYNAYFFDQIQPGPPIPPAGPGGTGASSKSAESAVIYSARALARRSRLMFF